MAANFAIILFIGALRHILQRQVGNGGQRRIQFQIYRLFLRLAVLNFLFQIGHRLHQALRRRMIALAFGRADLFGGVIARLLPFLQLRDALAAFRIQPQYSGGLRRQSARLQASVKLFRMFADEFQIVHCLE